MTAADQSVPNDGNAEFFANTVAIPECSGVNAILVQSGAASCSTTFTTKGGVSITAQYDGDGTTYDMSLVSDSVQHNVVTDTTVVAIDQTPPYTYPEILSYTATITTFDAGQAGGTVDFVLDSTTVCAAVSVASNTAKCAPTTPPGGGAHTMVANYSGGGTYDSSSASAPFTVGKADSQTTVAGNPNPSNYGDAVDITATVTGNGSTPTGSVTFTDTSNGNAVLCNQVNLDTNGKADCPSISSLTAGDHIIQAAYSGDDNYNASNGTYTQTVSQATTTTTPAGNPNPSNYGDAVDITAMVTDHGTIPTGTVTFTDTSNGNAVLCNQVKLDTNGKADCPNISSLTAGDHIIQAAYSGDSNYKSSNGTYTQTVNQATTTTTPAGNPNPSNYGDAVDITAVVTDHGTLPTGNVTFTDTSNGNAVLCNQVKLDANGKADCPNISSLTAGGHIIQAAYSGDSNYKSSNGTYTQTVNQAVTTTTPAGNPNPSKFGNPVDITAMVTDHGTIPTGTVTFTDTSNGNAVLCNQVKLDTNGKADCPNISSLTAGDHIIMAAYSGDSNYKSSNGTYTQSVGQSLATTTLTSSLNPSSVNQAVTFKAVVAGNGSIPTGTVTFTFNGINIPDCPNPATLDNTGTALCTTQRLIAPSDKIVATYNGDHNYTTSSDSLTQTVNKTDTATALQSSSTNDTSQVNDAVTFTATVTSSISGPIIPTGTVLFTSNGIAITSDANCPNPVPLDAHAVAKCTTQTLQLGSDTIKAVYNPDTNFNISYNNLTQTVIKGDSVTQLSSSTNDTSSVNQPVTFTANVSAKVPGPFAPAGGTVTFTADGKSIPECPSAVPLVNGMASCTTQSLNAASHAMAANYDATKDPNFNSSSGDLTQSVIPTGTTTTVTSTPNPSVATRAVMLTAVVKDVISGPFFAPTGMVTFTSNGAAVLTCPLNTSGVAACTTTQLASGVDVIVATYNADANFTTSSAQQSPSQVVQDFSIGSAETNPVLLTQGYVTGCTNCTGQDLFYAQNISASVAPANGYSDTVAMSCSVSLNGQAVSTPTCSVGSSTIANGQGTTSVKIMAGTTANPSPIGTYMVTITAADGTGPIHSTPISVTVVNNTSSVNVLVGGQGSATVNFKGPAGPTLTTFTCAQATVAGTPSTGQLPATLGFTCLFNPTTTTFDGNGNASVQVTVNTSASTTAELRRTGGILAAVWFGIPGILLIGSTRRKRFSRKMVAQMLGLLFVCTILMYGVACGGGFTRPQPVTSNATPGAYDLLVTAKGSDGVTYSAVVPVNVGH